MESTQTEEKVEATGSLSQESAEELSGTKRPDAETQTVEDAGEEADSKDQTRFVEVSDALLTNVSCLASPPWQWDRRKRGGWGEGKG
jgi:hypothetical protein